MKTREEVEKRLEAFRGFQAAGYTRYEDDGHSEYFRGWDDGVVFFINWLLEGDTP